MKVWEALRKSGNGGAPVWSWKKWLGEEFEQLLSGHFFSETSVMVDSLMVEDRFGIPTRFRIVEHGPRDLVAVSKEGDRFKITRPDRIVLNFDYRHLSALMAGACGLEDAIPVPLENSVAFTIGNATYPTRGPVITCLHGLDQNLLAAFAIIQRAGIGPANIILLSESVATEPIRVTAHKNGWRLIYADSVFELHAGGRVVKNKFGGAPLFTSGVAVDRWPLRWPNKPSWKDVRIRFPEENNQTAHIAFGRSARLFEYREISQFTDKRSGNPNKQWLLLRRFAGTGGKSRRVVRGRESREREKIYRQLAALSEALQEFFQLPEDPFIDVDSETVARFDVGMKGTANGEKTEDFGEVFEEMSSHDRLHKSAYDSDLD